MCVPADSHPPLAAVAGAAVDTERLRLVADDGALIDAFAATTPGASRGVVVLPDIRGLFTFYEELAVRFAEHGIDAIAIDYFARNDPRPPDDRSDFDWRGHIAQTTLAGVTSDTAAAVAWLRRSDEQRRVFVVGFCFGGSNAWHQAASGHGLSGAVGFYGHPDRPGFPTGASAVLERLDEIECPILALMGGDDPGIPAAEAHRFDTALDEADIEHEVVVYDNAPHSFFDRRYEQFAAESADAWRRVLAFVG